MTRTETEFPVLDRVPGQERAIAFLRRAAERPHHAYLLAGPEGGGKTLGARAFAAALERIGLEVCEASNGIQAMEQFDQAIAIA